MTDFTRNFRNQGNMPAEAAAALGGLVDGGLVRIDVDDTPDVTGGGTTATTGFQLRDNGGNPIAKAMKVGFGVYDDVNGVTPGANATLDTATAGSILSGAGTAELEVLTDATGKFTCTLTDAADETVQLIGAPAANGGPAVDATDREAVTFSA